MDFTALVGLIREGGFGVFSLVLLFVLDKRLQQLGEKFDKLTEAIGRGVISNAR